ncbi:MAG: capsule biosynthesis protein [Pseudomonadota bacterium]
MTTKPKAKKYRIRRGSHEGDVRRASEAIHSQSEDATFGEDQNAGQTIEAIRQEGLSGRQLRMARRVAYKHGLQPTSDYDAVRMLRERGIDPLQHGNMLEIVVKGGAEERDRASEKAEAQSGSTLPQTTAGAAYLPSTEMSPSERRAIEIERIQKEIAARRRRKVALLLTRLAFFVGLPTLIAGYYFFAVATPMYATKSEFLIIQSDNQGGAGIGGLLSGTQFATNADSIATQSYMQSKDAMLRLDRDAGFKAHFTQNWIDPIQRLTVEPTNEEAYRTYQRNVKIGFDPTEGMIRMEVIAADPQIAQTFSERLIAYAEDRVNNLSQQKREDQMRDALLSYENAEEERRTAQKALVKLQVESSTIDPEGVITALRGQINTVELQLIEKELQLAALLDNPRPNQARVEGARSEVLRLQDQLDKLNERMITASRGENSLAQLSVRIKMAQADLVTRDALLQSALQQVEQTRMEANRQVRYLTVAVEPVASEEPSYPRAFENTILAFLIFAGIYLMVSLTASILREQVTT